MAKDKGGHEGFSRWKKRRKNLKDADDEMAEYVENFATNKETNEICDKSNTVNHPNLQEIEFTCNGFQLPETSNNVSATAVLSETVEHQSTSQFSLANMYGQTAQKGILNVDTSHSTMVVSIPYLNNDDEDSNISASEDELDEKVETHSSVFLPLLSVALYLRHNLTKTALSHHLGILKVAMSASYKELKSPHNLLAKYEHLKTRVKKIFVCPKPKCSTILIVKDGKPDENQPCGHKYIAKQSNNCYVLQLPIEEQLVYFIKHHGLTKAVPCDPNVRSDVYSGELYGKLRTEGKIDDLTITLQANADGAKPFVVTKYSFWPFMGIVNEAKYKLRRNFVILMVLWYGNKKPPTEAFMGWAIDELNRIQREGIKIDGVKYGLRLLIVTTDTMARPLLRGTTQYNGEHGCDICLHPGERVKKGRGSARVYSEPVSNPTFCPRTKEQHLHDMELVKTTGIPIHGIQGGTPLAKLDDFDFIRAFVPEYLHSICQGAFRMFFRLWTLSKFSKQPWYIGNKMTVIRTRLAQVKPPYEVTRMIESFDDFPTWKASMYRTFGLFYFVVLEDILPKKYFDHFAKLSYAIFVLLQEEVTVTDVRKVDVLLKSFVIETESLYGIGWVGINIHFLTHLAQSVLDWGCLWATSTFIPEWFNGELLKLSNGSQAVIEQMANNYLLKLAVRGEAKELVSKDSLPPSVANLLSELLHLPESETKRLRKLLINDNKIELLGAPSSRSLNKEEKIALRRALSCQEFSHFKDMNFGLIFSFYPRLRLVSTNSIFTTISYKRSPKRINFCALLKNGKTVFIESIIMISCGPTMSHSFIFVRELGSVSTKSFLPEPVGDTVFSTLPGQTTRFVGKGVGLMAIDPFELKTKCVVAMNNSLTETFVVTALPNNLETD